MPDAETLAQIYGGDSNYAHDIQAATEDEGTNNGGVSYEQNPVISWLKRLPKGTFLDYGCGHGKLLSESIKLGWNSIGIEYSPEFAALVQNKTGAKIYLANNTSSLQQTADVLHIGDVLEHLTEINIQFPQILSLLKPNGILLAQGPLDANFNFFFLVTKWARKLYKGKNSEIQPQHVIIATKKGQLALFERFGLKKQEFTIYEEEHPAPAKICARELLQPRTVAMYSLRKFSKAMSSLRADEWGNRYFFAGIKLEK
jgi:2-polyprenyl-3-methyl-5-hydroxy-6-metoxy-1,4-benzoquinol methylase